MPVGIEDGAGGPAAGAGGAVSEADFGLDVAEGIGLDGGSEVGEEIHEFFAGIDFGERVVDELAVRQAGDFFHRGIREDNGGALSRKGGWSTMTTPSSIWSIAIRRWWFTALI